MKGLKFPLCAVNFWVDHGVAHGVSSLMHRGKWRVRGTCEGRRGMLSDDIYIYIYIW